MNPDFDDFDDVPSAQRDDETRSRVLPRVVVAVAIAGFIGLAWYAYQSGSDSMRTDDIAFVEAETTDYKERPAEAGGEEFPHKDKTIYDAISPYAADDAPKVEKLLPEPEQPVKPEATASADTFVKDSEVAAKEKASDSAQTAALASAVASTTESTAEKSKQLAKEVEATIAKVSDKPIENPAPAEIAKATEAKSASTPPAPEVTAQPKAPEVAAKPTPVAAPAPQTSGNGPFKVQLGAYKSESEANQTAKRILGKNGDVLAGKSQFIVKADLPNGTFYRLRFGGFATPEAAKSACATLTGRGQGCFFAGK